MTGISAGPSLSLPHEDPFAKELFVKPSLVSSSFCHVSDPSESDGQENGLQQTQPEGEDESRGGVSAILGPEVAKNEVASWPVNGAFKMNRLDRRVGESGLISATGTGSLTNQIAMMTQPIRDVYSSGEQIAYPRRPSHAWLGEVGLGSMSCLSGVQTQLPPLPPPRSRTTCGLSSLCPTGKLTPTSHPRRAASTPNQAPPDPLSARLVPTICTDPACLFIVDLPKRRSPVYSCPVRRGRAVCLGPQTVAGPVWPKVSDYFETEFTATPFCPDPDTCPFQRALSSEALLRRRARHQVARVLSNGDWRYQSSSRRSLPAGPSSLVGPGLEQTDQTSPVGGGLRALRRFVSPAALSSESEAREPVRRRLTIGLDGGCRAGSRCRFARPSSRQSFSPVSLSSPPTLLVRAKSAV
ncbi:unnamed protein product, partial [Protopolystoma xenopodis]